MGIDSCEMLYPRKRKGAKHKVNPNFNPAGKSIEERPEYINNRENVGDYDIDTLLVLGTRN
ncbi:hypothetical protein [Streptococcus pluranimalium]|uniref:hypothetical protein n=1 Tax=Streptococcus pluranimalium TaxID=82348 RepID=UPI003F676FE1